MRVVKVPSLLLAVVLQVMPLSRVIVATAPATGSSFAIISTWIAGALALLGGVDAVSGASTRITSAVTARATNGVAFSYRITTGPDVANTFAAAPLPAGLTVGVTTGRITGTPTVEGVFVILLTASDNNLASRTVKTNLTLTIVAPSGGGGGTAPSITTQPASQTVTAGGNANFSVVASGTAPLSYQWKLNGGNVAGATSSALALTGVQAGQAGSYTVVVTNSAGSATSSPATLTVNPAVVAPSITAQPASQTVTAGGNANFSVVASGTAPLSYQWKLNGGNVAGATSSALALTGVQAGQAGSYTVVVTNSAGSATSSPATLTVNPVVVAPSITAQPANQTVTAGGNANFSVVASGTAPLSYQWKLNGGNVAGATSSTLALTGVQSGQAGSYTVVVTNSAGSATSSPATLTVNPAIVAPSITTQPASQTVTAGGSASFSVVANGTAPLSYQWKLNGGNVTGATSSALALTGVQAGQAGSYIVVVTNSAGSATSSAATLTVTAAPVAPTITTQPVNQTVTAGGNASFSVVANGTAPLSYQWKLNGGNIAGATSATLALPGVQAAQAGSYTVVVTNVAGSATSSPATLTVNPAPVAPAIAAQPSNQTVIEGGSATFSVVATGTAPLSYQWRLNGGNLAGATSSNLALTGVTASQAGNYSVVVTNVAGTIASSAASLVVNPAPVAPTIVTPPVSQSVSVGGSAAFSVVANGTAPLSYQWQRNGADIAGATSSILSLSGITTNQAGAYSVRVQNSVSSVTSVSATLTVSPIAQNHVPTISSLPNRFTPPSTPTGIIPFTVGDLETAASNLIVAAYSTNLTLVPQANILIGGSGSDRTVNITPAPARTGESDILITVNDGIATSTNRFHLSVYTPAPTKVTVLTSGSGAVYPNMSLLSLPVGLRYYLSAVPAAGQEFAGWTGSLTSATPLLSFVMASNLVFEAKFIPSPYIPIAGTYNGLFYENDEVRLHSSGFVTVSVTSRGSYSGWLQNGSARYFVYGKMGLDCRATNVIVRPRTNSLTLELSFGWGGQADQLTGRLTDGTWTAAVVGDRSVFAYNQPAPYAGNYTVVFPGQDGDPSLPFGDGYGTVSVSKGGSVLFMGQLADGTRLYQYTTISKDGHWPLYSSLYVGKGALLGWIQFANQPTDDLNGTLSWIKQSGVYGAFYPNGFTNECKATGSLHTYPIGSIATPVLNLPTGTVAFTGGNLSDFSNAISVGMYSRVSNLSSNYLSLNISPYSGLFTGMTKDPSTGKYLFFQGAVLEKQNAGYGFLLGTNQSSRVVISSGN